MSKEDFNRAVRRLNACLGSNIIKPNYADPDIFKEYADCTLDVFQINKKINDMSEQTDTFRSMHEHNREVRHANQKGQTLVISNYCDVNDISIEDIQPWHLRLSRDGIVCDIMPQRGRFHIVTCNARGSYTDLVAFLNIIFQ